MSTSYGFDSSQPASKLALNLQPAGVSVPSIKRSPLLGLRCPKCRAYYFSDEPDCPVCESRRVTASEPAIRRRLYGLHTGGLGAVQGLADGGVSPFVYFDPETRCTDITMFNSNSEDLVSGVPLVEPGRRRVLRPAPVSACSVHPGGRSISKAHWGRVPAPLAVTARR